MKISVLGSGCQSCKKLHEITKKVIKDEGIDAEVEYSTDINRIIELGLMHGPVLVVNEKPVDLRSISEKDVKEAIRNNVDQIDSGNHCSCGGSC